MPHNYRHDAESRTQGECAHVTHENLRGISVEPQKAKARACKCAAKNGKLASSCDVGNIEIGRKFEMAGEICNDAQRTSNHDCRQNGETIKPIGEIHRIAETHHNEIAEQN